MATFLPAVPGWRAVEGAHPYANSMPRGSPRADGFLRGEVQRSRREDKGCVLPPGERNTGVYRNDDSSIMVCCSTVQLAAQRGWDTQPTCGVEVWPVCASWLPARPARSSGGGCQMGRGSSRADCRWMNACSISKPSARTSAIESCEARVSARSGTSTRAPANIVRVSSSRSAIATRCRRRSSEQVDRRRSWPLPRDPHRRSRRPRRAPFVFQALPRRASGQAAALGVRPVVPTEPDLAFATVVRARAQQAMPGRNTRQSPRGSPEGGNFVLSPLDCPLESLREVRRASGTTFACSACT